MHRLVTTEEEHPALSVSLCMVVKMMNIIKDSHQEHRSKDLSRPTQSLRQEGTLTILCQRHMRRFPKDRESPSIPDNNQETLITWVTTLMSEWNHTAATRPTANISAAKTLQQTSAQAVVRDITPAAKRLRSTEGVSSCMIHTKKRRRGNLAGVGQDGIHQYPEIQMAIIIDGREVSGSGQSTALGQEGGKIYRRGLISNYRAGHQISLQILWGPISLGIRNL